MAASVALPVVGCVPGQEAVSADTSEDGLSRLQNGNTRFAAGHPRQAVQDAARRAEVAGDQAPFAVVVGCSDSRVSPEVLFDQGLGDLFVVRTAGEVIDDVGLGSIEYAVVHLDTPLILVLGHSRCGAVAAALAGENLGGHLPAVIDAIQPAVAQVQGLSGDRLDPAVRAQVREVVEQLRNSEPVLAQRVSRGELQVVGACYDLATGRMEILESPGQDKALRSRSDR